MLLSLSVKSLKGACFKIGQFGVIETVILSSSAKPYLGVKVQSFREYQPTRERYRFLTRRRSPEVQYPRSQKRALLTVTPFCRRTVSGNGLAVGVKLQNNSLQRRPELVIGLAPRIASDSPSKPLLRSNDYFDFADRFESISLPTGPIPRPRTPAGAPYRAKSHAKKI